ncbi:hypothetical protein [Sphingobacterium wenxiniae]|uniref:GMP synthase (Glutamine-hydrolysing) n=1 Tax=Sphingobacterium wenxiniae TaxID=683125 RepID=A0A1I6T219_9SPHI|nr:hypothetical protein [Sphingobacterium wenxiniae]SFS83299.1 GMP synthase (glutamine-hydrolysing) [Sphingobacterium wenxiniae]
MKVHFIQHKTFEAPGAYLEWAIQRNHDITFSKVYENQPLPDTADDIDLLIIMAGPQSPDTTPDEIRNFDYTEMNQMLFMFLDKLSLELPL